MAPLPIEPISMEFPLIIPAIFSSLFLLTILLIKCIRRTSHPPGILVNSNNALDKIGDRTGRLEFPNDSDKHGAIIMDESTMNEIEAPSSTNPNVNASMMNLLLSHTPQSSFHNESGPAQSVSNENILLPPLHKPSPLATSNNPSLKSLDNATVLENTNSAHEYDQAQRRKGGSVSRDNSPSPDYDEVTQVQTAPAKESPKKSPLRAGSKSMKNPQPEKILDPPELPARNARLASFTSSKRPTVSKQNTEEVYESITDDLIQAELDKSPLSQDSIDDERTYASVDAREIKPSIDPPSLPAPRLPEPIKPVKDGTLDKKKRRNKNRNSFTEKSDSHPLPSEPAEPSTDVIRKKTKSFTPFNKIRPSKKPASESNTSTSPVSFEASGEYASKGVRGALPPLPQDHGSADSDGEEGYSCITATCPPVLPKKMSVSEDEDPYSELTYDPKKKQVTQEKIDVVAVDYSQADGNTSPMEIDQAYSSIDDVKEKKRLNPLTASNGDTDSDIPQRALPQPPIEVKVIVPHQYVKPEEVKRRKAEQRIRKEEERRLSGCNLPPPEATEPVSPDIEPERKAVTTSEFPSLKSIFSDFRKDGDVVTENMSSVLGLPPPEPPNDSDDETQSYASAAEVRERKAKKPIPVEPAPDVNPILEYMPDSMEVNAASFLEDIGDHTYSSVNDALTDAFPYEVPKFMLEQFAPTYEDPDDIIEKFDEPKSKIEEPQEDSTVISQDGEPSVSQKVSDDLSKLREQKGYVKVSHQKETVPEYASIDDVQKEKVKVELENSDSNVTESTIVLDDSTLTETQNEVSI